jgi:chromosome partitioning protein
MKVVAFANQKGGVGKTTLCGHAAVQADLQGCGPVVMLDFDKQGSLTRWWNAREAETPALIACPTVADLPAVLAECEAAGVQLVFIDTPPSVLESVAEVLQLADLIVVPLLPSPHDLHAVGATVDIADAEHVPFVFVLNTANAKAKLTTQAAVMLSQHGAIATKPIAMREDFRASMTDGRTVQEVKATSKGAEEVADLWAFIQSKLTTKKAAARAAKH